VASKRETVNPTWRKVTKEGVHFSPLIALDNVLKVGELKDINKDSGDVAAKESDNNAEKNDKQIKLLSKSPFRAKSLNFHRFKIIEHPHVEENYCS